MPPGPGRRQIFCETNQLGFSLQNVKSVVSLMLAPEELSSSFLPTSDSLSLIDTKNRLLDAWGTLTLLENDLTC